MSMNDEPRVLFYIPEQKGVLNISFNPLLHGLTYDKYRGKLAE